MSDDSGGSKTNAPTQHKLKKSREEGQVAQSHDFTMFFGVASVLIWLFILHNFHLKSLDNGYSAVFRQIQTSNLELPLIFGLTIELIILMLKPFLTIIILVSVLTTLITISQVNGIIFSKNFIEFKFDHLNPAENFKNTFSKKNLFKFCKHLFCITIFIILSYYIIKAQLPNLLKLWHLPLSNILLYLALNIAILCGVLLIAYFVFAFIDLIIEKHNMYKELMMSHEDIKKESKDTNGDPEIKQTRKQIYQELMEDDKLNDVMENATFVLANPTHLAIVVLFKPLKSIIPYVIAKAKDRKAQDIFKLAKKFEVPIIHDKSLTRKLYGLVKMGNPIPEDHLPLVMETIAKNLDQIPNLYTELQARVKDNLTI